MEIPKGTKGAFRALRHLMAYKCCFFRHQDSLPRVHRAGHSQSGPDGTGHGPERHQHVVQGVRGPLAVLLQRREAVAVAGGQPGLRRAQGHHGLTHTSRHATGQDHRRRQTPHTQVGLDATD